MEPALSRPDPVPADLQTARAQLVEQERRLQAVLEAHETERRVLAHQLHDHAAQTIAAILLGLSAVERELEFGGPRAQLAMLRVQLTETLRSIREIAVRLRPPTLDQLGLEPALHGLVDQARMTRGLEITLQAEDISARMAPYLEAVVFRVVDDLLSAAQAAVQVRVSRDRIGDALRILGGPFDPATAEKIVARIATRLDQSGGSITVHGEPGRTLHVRIPVPRESSDPAQGELPGAPARSSLS